MTTYNLLTKVKKETDVEIAVPSTKMNQTTHYKVVDTASSTYDASRSDSDVTTQSYKPTGNETELASYAQTGIQGQDYTASNPRVNLLVISCTKQQTLQLCLVN